MSADMTLVMQVGDWVTQDACIQEVFDAVRSRVKARNRPLASLRVLCVTQRRHSLTHDR
jgi:hypothetical protein